MIRFCLLSCCCCDCNCAFALTLVLSFDLVRLHFLWDSSRENDLNRLKKRRRGFSSIAPQIYRWYTWLSSSFSKEWIRIPDNDTLRDDASSCMRDTNRGNDAKESKRRLPQRFIKSHFSILLSNGCSCVFVSVKSLCFPSSCYSSWNHLWLPRLQMGIHFWITLQTQETETKRKRERRMKAFQTLLCISVKYDRRLLCTILLYLLNRISLSKWIPLDPSVISQAGYRRNIYIYRDRV
jgi:hypothetical protein